MGHGAWGIGHRAWGMGNFFPSPPLQLSDSLTFPLSHSALST
ncbi:hypothetical protein [Microcoleus sp. FACHB-68]|nr:hypothetical protein [Microcoleus sp. FACHB-68]